MFKTLSPYFDFLTHFKVIWKPFTSEIFSEAISKDKMIFLHIGQMGSVDNRLKISELFSDELVAETLNHDFISVAADEEDFPEASLLGWNVLQINHEEAEIPINLFLMPDATPITSTSVCDPDDIAYLLENLTTAFREKKSALSGMAQEAKMILSSSLFRALKEDHVHIADALERYTDDWSIRLMSYENYFRKPPFILKVPSMLFLLEYVEQKTHPVIRGFVEKVLDNIVFSAMHDPIDGGFFYEMDSYRLITSNGEKRLNDNALLALLLSKGYKMFGKEEYRLAAEDTIDFVKKCLKGKFGGYINSVNIGTEPEDEDYYKYSMDELRASLGIEAPSVAIKLGINPSAEGYIMQTPSYTSRSRLISHESIEKLREVRKRHLGIIKDEREITSYNMLFVSVLCKISEILNNPSQAHEAIELHQKIMMNCQYQEGAAVSRYPVGKGSSPIEGNLSDYADIISADITLFETTGEAYYKEQADSYLIYTINNYYNETSGMFFKSSKYSTLLPLKMESNIDNDRPSTNSIMCDNLLRMYKLTANETYHEQFLRQIFNIQTHLIGSGPYLGNWARQILKYLMLPEE